jgi:anion-transporting  ArsA/GET3 family ATPase
LDPLAFFATSRLVIVAGKGGVGKTTVTAALAVAAAKSGLRVLVVEVEGKSGLARLFGFGALHYDEATVLEGAGAAGVGSVQARAITPTDALLEYLVDHGMRRLSNRLVRGGALDVVATAAPGIEDILVLGKVKQLERSGAVDVILLDAPAAGHAITFLESARGLVDAVTVGPINTQARDVMEMLNDPERCSVVLVTLPEETPVNELVDTAYSLEDRVGISLGPVIVNGLYPERAGMDVDPAAAAEAAGVALMPGEADALHTAATFRSARVALQNEQLARLSERLPLPQIHLPFLFKTDLKSDDVHVLGDAVLEGIAGLGALPA